MIASRHGTLSANILHFPATGILTANILSAVQWIDKFEAEHGSLKDCQVRPLTSQGHQAQAMTMQGRQTQAFSMRAVRHSSRMSKRSRGAFRLSLFSSDSRLCCYYSMLPENGGADEYNLRVARRLCVEAPGLSVCVHGRH